VQVRGERDSCDGESEQVGTATVSRRERPRHGQTATEWAAAERTCHWTHEQPPLWTLSTTGQSRLCTDRRCVLSRPSTSRMCPQ